MCAIEVFTGRSALSRWAFGKVGVGGAVGLRLLNSIALNSTRVVWRRQRIDMEFSFTLAILSLYCFYRLRGFICWMETVLGRLTVVVLPSVNQMRTEGWDAGGKVHLIDYADYVLGYSAWVRGRTRGLLGVSKLFANDRI